MNAGGAQLSKLVRKYLKRKQGDQEPTADYLSEMRAKLAQIEKYQPNLIWDVMKTTAVVLNLKDDPETKLTKKLVTNRMAEAETEGKTLTYDQIESIIENDQADDDESSSMARAMAAQADAVASSLRNALEAVEEAKEAATDVAAFDAGFDEGRAETEAETDEAEAETDDRAETLVETLVETRDAGER